MHQRPRFSYLQVPCWDPTRCLVRVFHGRQEKFDVPQASRIEHSIREDPMRIFLAILSLSALLLTGCSASDESGFAADGSCDGVIVEVNFVEFAPAISSCVVINGSSEVAKDVLGQAGVNVEGTRVYGDAVVCRVNGVPSATEPLLVEGEEPHLETCDEFPPAFAYWSLWVKESDDSEWDYAMEGVGSLQLSKGQSVGLALTLGGVTITPSP